MSRKITCTNNRGYTISFTEEAFSPFLLASVDGIYSVTNKVSISENTMTDGGTYQGSIAKVRNIVLTVMDAPEKVWRMNSRDLLYRLFPKDTLGLFTYEENGDKREIKYRVEYVKQGEFKKRLYTISLICEDPYFYGTSDIRVQMASVVDGFEFPHDFYSWEEISWRSQNRIATFNNENAVDGIGMNISIRAIGNVSNVTVSHIEKEQHITIGHSAKPLYLERGDELLITTSTNDKHIYLKRDGVQSEINEYLTEDSEFIQLTAGINNIGYSAETGVGNLILDISYRMKYSGA